MGNPILQMMQGNRIKDAIKSMSGKDNSDVIQTLNSINPKFEEFYNKNAGRPLQDICAEYGVDYNVLHQIIKNL